MSAPRFKIFVFVFIMAASSVASAQVQWALDTVVAVGTNPTGIAITSDGSKLVVTDNTTPGAVQIMSTSDYSFTTIDVSSIENDPNGVTVSPNDSMALVCTTHNIIFISLSNNSVKGHFTAPCSGTTLYGIAVSPDGKSAVFPDLSDVCTGQVLRLIDASGPSSSSTSIPVTTSGELYGIAVAPDSISALVTTFTSGSPVNVNLATGGVQSIAGFSGSYGIAMFHKSNEALIYDGDSLDLVSLATNSIIKKITSLTYTTTFQNIAITSDDKYAFAVGSFDKQVISLTADTVLQTFTAGGTNVAAAPDGSKFYVTDSYNGTVRVYKMTGSTGVRNDNAVQPSGYELLQNYPNPFNPSTTIEFRLPARSNVQIKIYDALGRLVRNLVSGEEAAGSHQFVWDGRNDSGLQMPSGVYFYQLRTDKFAAAKRMLYLK